MNWIKQNNVLAAIAAVALVGAAVLGWFAYANLAAAAKSVAKYKSSVKELNTLQAGQLYPSGENLKAKNDAVSQLASETEGLRKTLAKQYGAAEGGDPATFGQRAQRRYEDLRKDWEAAGMKVPDNFFLGLERYRDKVAAPREAIRSLDFQLEAIAFLVASATESGLVAIERFERAPVPGEEGNPIPARGKDEEGAPAKPLSRLGMEIQCVGSEPAMRAFINAIAASKKHFLAFRAIRMQNEVPQGPIREDVRNKVKTADTLGGAVEPDLFAALSTPAEPAAPVAAPQEAAPAEGSPANPAAASANPAAAPAASTVQFAFATPGVKDAYQFLGGERVKAVIQLDLVVFDPIKEEEAEPSAAAAEPATP